MLLMLTRLTRILNKLPNYKEKHVSMSRSYPKSEVTYSISNFILDTCIRCVHDVNEIKTLWQGRACLFIRRLTRQNPTTEPNLT